MIVTAALTGTPPNGTVPPLFSCLGSIFGGGIDIASYAALECALSLAVSRRLNEESVSRTDMTDMRKSGSRDVSETVKDLRAQLGLTQEQFAAKVGVTWSTVNRWENGRGKPSPLALQHIEEILREVRKDAKDEGGSP